MRRAVLGIVAAVLLPVLAGCGSDGNGHRLFAADVVSTQARDGDVTRDLVVVVPDTVEYADVTQNVIAGIEVDALETPLSESRGILRFSLTSIPPDADVQSAVVSVFVNSVTPVPANGQAEIPFLIELIDTDLYPSSLGLPPFGASALLSRRTFFRGADMSSPDPVPIDVTGLLREALAQRLSEFEVRLAFDYDRWNNDPSTISAIVEIDDADDTPSHRRIDFAPLLQVDYF